MPCLATRTLDDDPRVRRTPSVGWLSKSMAGEGKDGGGDGEWEGMKVGLTVTEKRASSRISERISLTDSYNY